MEFVENEICTCPPPYWRKISLPVNGVVTKNCHFCNKFVCLEIVDKNEYKAYKIKLALTTPEINSMFSPFDQYLCTIGKEEEIIAKYLGDKYFEK